MGPLPAPWRRPALPRPSHPLALCPECGHGGHGAASTGFAAALCGLVPCGGAAAGKTTVPYEESGWYDGQLWVKPEEVSNRDRLIVDYQVLPVLRRIRRTIGAMAALLGPRADVLAVAFRVSKCPSLSLFPQPPDLSCQSLSP